MEQAYLIELLKAFLREEQPPVRELEDPQKLLQLAKIHNVTGILGYMDMQYGIFPQELRPALRRQCLATMGVFAQRAELAKAFFSRLEEEKVAHCTMKGMVLRELYPIPELRTFSDVDILIHPKDREASHKLLQDMGFTVKTDWEPVYSYQREQEYYELHTQLLEVELSDRADYRSYFDKAWEHAQQVSQFGYCLKPEFHFIYLLTHIAKHVQGSGAGIRMYLDIAVFVRHYEKSLDWGYVRRELESLSLWQFACTVLTCVESWFGVVCPMEHERPEAELVERFTQFTLEAGVFGKHGREAGLASLKKEASASRLTVLLKRLFPGAKTIERRYTYLQSRPWLLPVAWVHRVFKTDISLKDHAKEARTILRAEDEQVMRLAGLCRDVGL